MTGPFAALEISSVVGMINLIGEVRDEWKPYPETEAVFCVVA